MNCVLNKLINATPERKQELCAALEEAFSKFQINTPQRKAHFLAQILHESAHLSTFEESLYYRWTTLMKVFKKYFPTETSARSYEKQPQKIANRVYANRMGNGNEASGDGWKYRGRGSLQITGKDNYRAVSKGIGVDFVSNPDPLKSDKYAILSAGWWWKNRGLNELADISKDDVTAITKKVNGGINGLRERQKLYFSAKTAIAGSLSS